MASLSGWKKALKNAVDYPWDSDINSDHPECPHCGSTMDFHGHDHSEISLLAKATGNVTVAVSE